MKQATYNGIPDNKQRMQNVCSSIFTGRTPVYDFDDDSYIIIGQKNNQNGKINIDNPKYATKHFHDSNPKDLFLRKGDIILNSLGGGSVGRIGYFDLDNDDILTDGHPIVFRTNPFNYSKYIYYALINEQKQLEDMAVGSTNQCFLNVSDVTHFEISVPPISEQYCIADFLDSKCSQIDEISKKIQEEIDTLEEYKKSVITEAVTKGLDPNAEMKDSGIEWNPVVPSHWTVVNPKALFKLRNDRAKPGDRQLTSSQEYGIIYQDEYMELTGTRIVTVQKDFDILKRVYPDDFVISMRSFQGGLEYSERFGSISSAYVMLIPNKEYVYAPFYRWFFKSSKYINAIQSTSNLVRDGQAMRYANFIKVPLFIIPMKEQQVIADYLNKKCNEIDGILSTKRKQLSTLEEYKKSLIYEYVTGKKEVA